MTKPPRTPDPAFTGRFKFKLDNIDIGMFTEVSGLSVQIDVEELVEGGQNQFVHKLPGRMKWPNLVLKRGYTGDHELYDWAAARTDNGDVIRRQIAITLMDQAGNPVKRWEFTNAWPVKWELSELDASKNEVSIETIEIAHEGLSLARDE
jgi:phage tail-like protein